MKKILSTIIAGCIKGFLIGSGVGYWLTVFILASKKTGEVK